jgi:hypothetical protein
MNIWIKSLTTSMLIASLVASPVQAAAMKATPAMAAVAAACTDLDTNTAGRKGCVAELQKSIAADPASLKVLQEAAASGKTAAAKDALLKMGLSEAELADAKIVINDQSKAAARAKVTIEITCCPLTITITIRL